MLLEPLNKGGVIARVRRLAIGNLQATISIDNLHSIKSAIVNRQSTI
jgi:hypothetical protein